jgi:hypothetical protein
VAVLEMMTGLDTNLVKTGMKKFSIDVFSLSFMNQDSWQTAYNSGLCAVNVMEAFPGELSLDDFCVSSYNLV